MIDLRKYFLGKYYHSNYLSYKIRKFIEKIDIRKVLGLQFTLLTVIAGIIIPQINIISSKAYASYLIETTPITQNTKTEVTFNWPLDNFQISQSYHFYHPALDLTTSYDNPVLAIGGGTVETTEVLIWGYGRNIIVRHDNGYSSLYAHLSKILVNPGDRVTQGQTIGTVGSSGWSTGSHLHIEIRGPEGSVNPLEVFPTITPEKNS